ncbi:MAG: hypothetical protein WC216_03210 [Gallionella sp.]
MRRLGGATGLAVIPQMIAYPVKRGFNAVDFSAAGSPPMLPAQQNCRTGTSAAALEKLPAICNLHKKIKYLHHKIE